MLGAFPIPGHITALYIFAVVNLMALFHITLVEANVIVRDQYNITLEELPDLPAKFGPGFPVEGLSGHIVYAEPHNACEPIQPPPEHTDLPWIAIIRRKDCNFDEKVLNAQKQGYVGVLVHNVGSDDLIPMGGGSVVGKIKIPSAFIGETDATYLVQNFSKRKSFYIIIDNKVPFNANLYLLPFAIVVGICFVLMLVFMVAKWIRDLRRRRRSRLSKQNLKKIPIKKFKKGDPYDVCAICLDEYEENEKLRVLPCNHAYHMKCIDPWLTKNKRTCPVCKRKVIPGDEDETDSDTDTDEETDTPRETTPLLTSQSAATFATSRNAFDNSGLPADARSDVQDIPSRDSDSDISSAEEGGASVSQSAAEVHASPVTTMGGRGSGYGSMATATVANERADVASIHSNVSAGSLEGAVGGVSINNVSEDQECIVDFIDDHYGEENEMRGLVGSSAAPSEDDSEKKPLMVKVFGRSKRNKKKKRDEDA